MTKFKKFLNNPKVYRSLIFTAFILFIAILTWIVIFKIGKKSSILIAFEKHFKKEFSARILHGLTPSVKLFFTNHSLITDFLLNVLAFTPFGIYLPLVSKKRKFLTFLLITFTVSLFYELFQLITMFGHFDIDDLIANSLGFIIGYYFYVTIVTKLNPFTLSAINCVIILIALIIFI